MKTGLYNPIAFTPLPVTIVTSTVYAALIIALLVIHLVVPSAPHDASPVAGINITEAWQDLQTLSNGFHPYNSRRNDAIRDWLLQRINTILDSNKITHGSQYLHAERVSDPDVSSGLASPPVYVVNDMTSNVSFSPTIFGSTAQSVYFEGTNVMVYIRGTEDDADEWWHTNKKPNGGGVLVNAHYDSVSTGFGATDDGVGVVTILQLIKHFTTTKQQPKKGIIALLNNGEEDGLHGAMAFTQHPISKFPRAFLNLEGAGAGGRAALFRSTDSEVTKFYARTKYPFGTALSGDTFERGLIRSQTDYVIFNGALRMRGLDLAFMEPRARYHTDQDDSRHTSVDSLWHMLSAALATMQGLSSDTSSTFDEDNGNMPSRGSDGVWFDLFGSVFVVFRLRTLFALSVTLLVVTPITLLIVGAILFKLDKLYLFTSSKHHHHSDGDDTVAIHGWRGFFRDPIIFVMASAGVVGLAFLLAKVNPYIIYSSPYSVWSMMLSAWLYVTWFFSRAADFVRPTALHRTYSLLWMFVGGWFVLIAVTVLEDRLKVAAGYPMVFYFAAVFVSTVIGFLELFRLPKQSDFVEEVEDHQQATNASTHSGSTSNHRILAPSAEERREEAENQQEDDQEEATESTSLLRNGRSTTFAHYLSPHTGDNGGEPVADETEKRKAYGDEQPWSRSLPRWTWLLQFIIMMPVAVILLGQIGLLSVSGTYQTLADGNSALTVYIAMAVLSVLILLPLGPFLHRYTYHIPTFLLLVFTGTLIYNLVAFPFSTNNRLKLYFIQRVDLDVGTNEVALTGVGESPYLAETIKSLPSAAGQRSRCVKSQVRRGLIECIWIGISPTVVPNTPGVPPSLGYADWISFNSTREVGKMEARIQVWGRNTRACKLVFNTPISDFTIDGAGHDSRFRRVPEGGSVELALWSRTNEKPWIVNIKWEAGDRQGNEKQGLDGRVACLWNDENDRGVIPALDEIKRFAPDWVAITKNGAGLVEGSKAFLI
ncbi:hypothetical protein MMC06_002223 [Schaereria dolodes]|nr:hypothetical protein [Schaereria dolodes]